MSLEHAQAMFNFLIKTGYWSPAAYPPPPYSYPEGIETPGTLPNLTAGLLNRGFHEDEVKKILGSNWLCVFEAVWG